MASVFLSRFLTFYCGGQSQLLFKFMPFKRPFQISISLSEVAVECMHVLSGMQHLTETCGKYILQNVALPCCLLPLLALW